MSLSLSELLATTSEAKQAHVCPVKTAHILREDRCALAHMRWISVHTCGDHRSVSEVSFLLVPAGLSLEVQTSLEESKI